MGRNALALLDIHRPLHHFTSDIFHNFFSVPLSLLLHRIFSEKISECALDGGIQ